MGYTPVTPFRRTMDAVVLAHQSLASKPIPIEGIDKWQVLRDLAAAREAYGLSDRDLTVLQALLSFSPTPTLGNTDAGLVVYPSNRTICERLNGMPCSTMRRHLARLVEAGIVLRRDSPNGKRYVRRYGGEKVAFGFDLTPLVTRFDDIQSAANEARDSAVRLKHQRETVSLMRRDLANLAEYGASLSDEPALWDRFTDLARLTAHDLRRKLTTESLAALEIKLSTALHEVRDILEPPKAEEMSTCESRNGQHHQTSNKDMDKSEPCEEANSGEGESCAEALDILEKCRKELVPKRPDKNQDAPKLPLNMVLAACSEIQTYADGPIRSWHDLINASETVRPMMGITQSAWGAAHESMGRLETAIVTAAMLERFSEIRCPGAYLRYLSTKAALKTFSSSSMLMSLLRREAA